MAKVEFNYRSTITTILCSEEETLETICERFCNKTGTNINNFIFLYSGHQINLHSKYSQSINGIDKQRKIMSILVVETEPDKSNKNSTIIKSIFPICPICKENIKIEFDEYKINCFGCRNGHSTKINIDEYDSNQSIDISKIECNFCKTNKYNTYNNEMYFCNTCNFTICPLCRVKHNKEHYIINYDSKNYICPKHNELYISYCKDCEINICIKCQKEHKKHKMILYGEILPEKDDLLNKLREFENIKNIFNKFIERTIDKLNNVKENIEILYKIYYEMINKYEDKYRNYEIFQDLDSINNNVIIKDLQRINNIDNIKTKIENILNIYEKITFKDEITMIYKINNEKKIKIFGEKFVENYKDICKIIFNNKIYELTEEFDVDNINSDRLVIKVKNINNITNMEEMFTGCKYLESLPDICNFNTHNVKDMSHLFSGCSSLLSLADISKWDISNVEYIQCLFNGCSSLKSLPDISKWNTSKVTNFRDIFCSCNLLESIPDISKWNVNEVTDFSGLFYKCSSLKSLPDISNWNTKYVTDINKFFYKCSSLTSLPIYQNGIYLK